jgi:hypothetical protein
LAFDDLFWPSLAFLAFVALDDFLKQKLAFADETCFQQSDVKPNLQMRLGILNHCDICRSINVPKKAKYTTLM